MDNATQLTALVALIVAIVAWLQGRSVERLRVQLESRRELMVLALRDSVEFLAIARGAARDCAYAVHHAGPKAKHREAVDVASTSLDRFASVGALVPPALVPKRDAVILAIGELGPVLIDFEIGRCDSATAQRGLRVAQDAVRTFGEDLETWKAARWKELE